MVPSMVSGLSDDFGFQESLFVVGLAQGPLDHRAIQPRFNLESGRRQSRR